MGGKIKDAAGKWWREKEGVLAIWLVAVWTGVTVFFLWLLLVGRMTAEALQFYASFSYLPGSAVAGIFVYSGVRAFADRPPQYQPPQPPQYTAPAPAPETTPEHYQGGDPYADNQRSRAPL